MIPSGVHRMVLFFAWAACWTAMAPGRAVSQGCTGTMLYKEDFGGNASSPDIGSPLPDGVTNYTFTTDVVSDGLYSIRKTVPVTYQSWLHGPDHSGDGFMMVVNASYTPGLFYETRVDGLCQGSSFYFSAWIANLLRADAADPLDPNLKFVIRRASDSTVIDSLETGTLPRFSVLTWKQYGIHFDLPAGESSVILQIFNHQTGGSGNDLVLDDISFSLCGPQVGISETGVYQQSFDVCRGSRVALDASVEEGFYRDPAYQWQFSTDSLQWTDLPGAAVPKLVIPSAAAADSGWYRLLTAETGNIGSGHCRAASGATPLYVFGAPDASIATQSPVCEGGELRLAAAGGIAYRWEGPGGFQAADSVLDFPSASLTDAGLYTLTLTGRGGCVSTGAATVSVQADDLKVSLPPDDSILCEGTTRRLDVTNPGAAYLWNTGETGPVLTVDTAGFYQVTVTKGVCSRSDSLGIREVSLPVADLGDDTTICYGEPFRLQAAFPEADSYLWQDGSGQPFFDVLSAGTYSVVVKNTCGSASSSVVIHTEECADRLLFPTAFSPNGDGQNDLFRPRVLIQVTGYRLRVMDRWGRTVFASGDPARGWDGLAGGSRAPTGAYVWIAGYVRSRDGQRMLQKGAVTLVR